MLACLVKTRSKQVGLDSQFPFYCSILEWRPDNISGCWDFIYLAVTRPFIHLTHLIPSFITSVGRSRDGAVCLSILGSILSFKNRKYKRLWFNLGQTLPGAKIYRRYSFYCQMSGIWISTDSRINAPLALPVLQ